MHVTVRPSPPAQPTAEERAAALRRYRARIPAQVARCERAAEDVEHAKEVLVAAEAELAGANEAMSRLQTYIKELEG